MHTKPVACLKAFGWVLPLALLAACQSTPVPPAARSVTETARAAAEAPPTPPPVSTKVVDLHGLPDLAAIIPRLAEARVVFIGEGHTNYADHLNQLAIIRALHERQLDLAIGMEYFQQPFQADLDAYSAGRLTETELLAKTEYFKRWGYDFRLYELILHFARDNRIPLVALNLPSEIVQKVGRSGISSLTEQERAEIPRELDRSDPAYREYLQAVYRDHPHPPGASFEYFFEGQLVWDEGMAARAARYLEAHPARRLVVLSGVGHVQYGFGIPDRLTRRIEVTRTIIVNGLDVSFKPNVADFVLLSGEVPLPPAGTLGVVLEPDAKGLRIGSFARDSAAQAAGLDPGDRIVSLDGQPMKHLEDARLALWDKRPGDRIRVEARRGSWIFGAKELSFEVTLR